MRGRLWLVTALAVGAAVAIPATSGAQAPAQDSVSGSGVAGFFGGFQIDVRSGPTGQNPSGQASFGSAVGLLSGPASCLAIRGNVATFNIQTTSAFGQVTFQVTDNAGLGLPDVIAGIPTSRSPGDCSPVSAPTTGTVSSGDVVVVDAPPLPTSKDQCKKGGWRTFGVFKNQGDCVSFVATGGKNPPAGP